MFLNKIAEKMQSGEYSLFQKLAMYNIQQVVQTANGNGDAHLELAESLERVKAWKNYEMTVAKTQRQAPVPFVAQETFRDMILGQMACAEEDSRCVKRVNKSRKIEKEFKEKKLQSVLLSNKETKRILEEQSGLTRMFCLSLFILAVYATVPMGLIMGFYNSGKDMIDTSLAACQFVSDTNLFKSEVLESFNTLMLLTHINKYHLPFLTKK